jgi:hypothetical protein
MSWDARMEGSVTRTEGDAGPLTPGRAPGLALAADAGFIERVADPGAFIIRACEQARARLREALESGEIDRVAEVRSEAEAARAYAARSRLEKDAQLAVAELVRRAERGIGLAIRQGQEEGTIRGRHNGRRAGIGLLRSPADFASLTELSPGGGQPGIYALTDGIPDEAFEAAVTEARAEGNLSRANVARKANAHAAGLGGDWVPEAGNHHGEAPAQRRRLIRTWASKGYSSRQIAGLLGMGGEGVRRIARAEGVDISADIAVAGSRHLDSARIVRETVHSLEGLVMGIELAGTTDLDPAEAAEWAASLTTSVRALNRFARKLRRRPSERA